MEARIEMLPEKKLIGKRLIMSLSDNRTFELWRSFMSERKKIEKSISADLFCLQVYPPSYNFKHFNPEAKFEKWAAMEVANFDIIPDEMESYTVTCGLYAVFIHKGAASAGYKTFRYIFETWLPRSDYAIDNRPHFELLGEKYKNDDADSEEEVWIPIKQKSNVNLF